MDNERFLDLALTEHQFWLQIMGDHARFILYSLAVTEVEPIQRAIYFKEEYDQLLDWSRQELFSTDLMELNQQAGDLTNELKEFKLQLLSLTLTEDIKVQLPPTFFNHMINELEEYQLIITAIANGEYAAFHPLHYHLKWLPDAMGHAASVGANLDIVEKEYIKSSNWFETGFSDLFLKSTEFKGYMRTNLHNFPALTKLNKQVIEKMVPFMKFLEEMRDLRRNNRVLGTLLPLMADHMAREECYYLIKISQKSEATIPDCNPARPRIT